MPKAVASITTESLQVAILVDFGDVRDPLKVQGGAAEI
jgi:hypothetical protein